ncbi:MAG: CHASE3 domain-containing protein, partial [Candidatus Angelobacter sp.]
MTFSTMKKTAAGLCLAGAFLLFASAMAYRTAKWSLENSFWVSHTREVLGELNAIQADLAQSGTAWREYLISADGASLKSYRDHLSRLGVELERVGQLTADNATQQVPLQQLRAQIKNVTELLDEGIVLREKQGHQTALQFSPGDRGKELRDEASATVRSMKAEEEHLLEARQTTLRRSMRRSTITFAAAVGFEFLLLALIYYVIRKELVQRAQTERALRESEERFRLLVSGITDYAIYRLSATGHVAT